MAVQVSYPGVYIEEFAPGAPIQGASVSTPAFIGVATDGPIASPTRITSWDAFRHTFGEHALPGFYLWYAVKGFFDNGGQSCHVVRASNGQYGEQAIATTSGAVPLFTVRARQPGSLAIQLGIAKTSVLAATLFLLNETLAAAAAAGDTKVVVSAAAGRRIRPGDRLTIAAAGEQLTVLRVIGAGATATVLLSQPLAGPYGAGDPVRFVDTLPGETTFRLSCPVPVSPDVLAPGAMLTFTQAPAPARTQLVQSVQKEVLDAATTTYRVTLREGLGFAVDMTQATTVASNEFDFTVQTGAGAKSYPSLALDPAHPRYYVDVVNGDAGSAVTLLPATPTPAVPMPGILPQDQALAAMPAGVDQDVTLLNNAHFTSAIDTLHLVPDASILACPDNRSLAVQRALIDQCELLADRFAVLDCDPQLDPFDTAAGVPFQRAALSSARGYAAYYYPWIRVPPEGAGPPVLVPPSGHVCGVYARVDATRGVFKAPANEFLNGALGVERALTDIEHGLLNLSGVDVTRVFQGGGRPIVFGARTTATDTNWQYVNIRRLFIFLEKSIQQGIQWAVFEPNNLQLWQKLRRSIGDFLNRQWREGALFGAKAEEAYYVRIDETLNPFSEQQLGRLHIEIGVRPSYPAEFIIVRIGIWPGGSAVTEG